MTELWLRIGTSISQEQLFWALGVAGTSLFALRLIIMFFGGFFDDAGLEGDHHEYHDWHDGPSLKILTIYSLAGFCMMFGWTGLAVLQHYPGMSILAVGLAMFVGLATMVLAAWGQRLIRQLASTGTRFTVQDSVGMMATVYQRIIPATGGKIQLLIDGMTRELVAFSENGQTIETMTAVVIVKIIDDHTVVVALAQ
jgi:hypothetical protein